MSTALTQLLIFRFSYLLTNKGIAQMLRNANDASEASESRDMQSTIPSIKDTLPRSLSNMNSVLQH